MYLDCVNVSNTSFAIRPSWADLNRNHPEKLDPALRRPGRFDIQISFHHTTPAQAKALFKHFYPISQFDHDSTVKEKGIMTSEQLEELADAFVSAIFTEDESTDIKAGRTLSMAALQGYLIGHKKDPLIAVEKAKAWARS